VNEKRGQVHFPPRKVNLSPFLVLLLPALIACSEGVSPQARSASLAEVREALKPRGKPLVVNHWATWCQPCVEELPMFARMARNFAGKADFLGISWDLFAENPGKTAAESSVRALSEKAGIPYDSLLSEGDAEALGEMLGLKSLVIPQTWIYSREGKVIRTFEGIETEEDLREFQGAIEQAVR